MIRLVGIDVDGTLVGSSGVVEPAIWEAARRARTAGIHLALCSGRPAFGVALEYARKLDASGWHVFQNGASIVHLSSNRSLSAHLPEAAVSSLIAQARRNGRVLELYSDDDYVTESTSRWAHEHAALLGVEFQPRPFETLRRPVVRAQWLISATDVRVFMADVPAHLEVAQSTSPLMPQTQFIGLTQAGVNKGSAIRTVAAAYDIDLQEVMYIGDAGNDLSAMEVVGCPIAMGNADPAVMRMAKHVVGHVDSGALAQALALAAGGLEHR